MKKLMELDIVERHGKLKGSYYVLKEKTNDKNL